MATLKLVMVLITVFTEETDAKTLRDYIKNCYDKGTVATLFKDPNITAAFYALGLIAYEALRDAITAHDLNQSEDNENIMKDKMALAVLWLRSYASQVQVISNLPANCTTREEAATNIGLSYLTAQKLSSSTKGQPETAVITAKYLGDGIIEVIIVNGISFNPSSINIIAVGVPPVTDPATPNPVITLNDGQVIVTCKVAVPMISKSLSGKGKTQTLSGMNTCPSYLVALYSQNGAKLISFLSNIVLVTLITPPL